MASIGEAWSIVSKNLGPYLAACCLTMVPALVGYAISVPIILAASAAESVPAAISSAVVMLLLILVGSLVGCLFGVGMVAMTLKALRGEKPSYSDVFVGFKVNPIGLLIAIFLINLAVNIAANCFLIPGLVLGGLWFISVPYMLEKGMGPVEAMRASFETLRDHIVMATIVYLLASIAAMAGVIACGIGLLITLPLYFAVTAIVYEDMTADLGPEAPSQYASTGPLGVYGTEVPSRPSDPYVGPGQVNSGTSDPQERSGQTPDADGRTSPNPPPPIG